MLSKTYLSFVILIACLVLKAESQCSINIKTGMHKERPPSFISLTNPPTYVYPSIDDPANLDFNKGEEVTIFCPSQTNGASTNVTKDAVILVNDKPSKPSTPLKSIKCVNGEEFKIDKKIVNFKDISCEEKNRISYNAIQKNLNKKCINGDRYEIGYDLGSNGFLRTIEFCHDKKNAKTLWAHAIIVPANQQKYRYSGPAKSFKAGNLYKGLQMSKKEPYNLKVAFQTLVTICGDIKKTETFLSPKTEDRKYLAKGHLVANADKFYKSEQDSTYFFANAVPMWQQINANPGNWFFVEEYVRHLAFLKKHELDIYVGGIGTLKLDGKEINLYRSDDGSDNKLPVPKILYKCVIDKKSKEAICFLVVNNPYVSKEEVENSGDEYIVCDRINQCDQVAPMHNHTELGYMYCCNLETFYLENHEELGLEDVKSYLKFKQMRLLTK